MKRAIHIQLEQIKRSAVLGAALFLCASTGFADGEVTLTSKSGSLEITGHLIGQDRDHLQIQSRFGPMVLNADEVNCSGAACPNLDSYVPSFRISGEKSVTEVLLPALWSGFARSKGWTADFEDLESGVSKLAISDGDTVKATLFLSGTTSDQGFTDLFTHTANAVISTREVTDEELQTATALDIVGLDSFERSRIIALDAITPIVSPLRDTKTLSLVQLQRAFLGEVIDWRDFGEPAGPIELHLGPQASGTTQAALNRLVGQPPVAEVTFHDDIESLNAAVISNRNAIGLTSFLRTAGTQSVALRDDCGFVTSPDVTGIKTEDYPLSTPVLLYIPDRIVPEVIKDFIAWLRTPAAHLIVRRSRFIDQAVEPISLDAQGQRFANAIERAGGEVSFDELQRFVRLISAQTRLSISFRFEPESEVLDAQSQSNLIDLAHMLRNGVYDGHELTLIGFSDGEGDAKANRDFSGARAETVRSDLLALLGGTAPENVKVSVAAFGEALPLACDDSELGQRTNQRVELWISD